MIAAIAVSSGYDVVGPVAAAYVLILAAAGPILVRLLVDRSSAVGASG